MSSPDPHAPHGGPSAMEWLITHTGGFILPFGKKFEKVVESNAVWLNSGVLPKVALIFFVISTPIILIEFALRFLGS